jgi:hypothetical protein
VLDVLLDIFVMVEMVGEFGMSMMPKENELFYFSLGSNSCVFVLVPHAFPPKHKHVFLNAK